MKIYEKIPLRAQERISKIPTENITGFYIWTDDNFDWKAYLWDEINSPDYPFAVDPVFLADETEQDKSDRAQQIISQLLPDLKTRKFLDFGCGEGHLTDLAGKTAELAIGYDTIEQNWNIRNPKSTYTNSWDKISENAPYDVILCYDVLDHATNPIECLMQMKTVLRYNGRIIVRNHPWCSRNGTHLYRQINKAFIHFFFSDEDLQAKGYTVTPTSKITHPVETYKQWYQEAGLKVSHFENQIEAIEQMFIDLPQFADLIKAHYKDSYNKDLATGKVFPQFQLGLQFLDYHLTH